MSIAHELFRWVFASNPKVSRKKRNRTRLSVEELGQRLNPSIVPPTDYSDIDDPPEGTEDTAQWYADFLGAQPALVFSYGKQFESLMGRLDTMYALEDDMLGLLDIRIGMIALANDPQTAQGDRQTLLAAIDENIGLYNDKENDLESLKSRFYQYRDQAIQTYDMLNLMVPGKYRPPPEYESSLPPEV